jgi:hypothetical protein
MTGDFSSLFFSSFEEFSPSSLFYASFASSSTFSPSSSLLLLYCLAYEEEPLDSSYTPGIKSSGVSISSRMLDAAFGTATFFS